MLTLLKFEADWCKPCQNMKKIVEQLDREDKNLIVRSVNIENDPQLRVDYHIRSIPAFVLIRDQKEIARKTGSCTLDELKEFVDESRGL